MNLKKSITSILLSFVGLALVVGLWSAISSNVAPDLPSPIRTWEESRIYIMQPWEKRGEMDQGIGRMTAYSLLRVAKGFALALLIEALTGGLTGFGRADPQEGWGATVFVQVLDPQAFGGRDAFLRQMQWLADACHAATPRPGGTRVRLPGERGLALLRSQAADGVRLHPSILPALEPWADKLGVPIPVPT